MSSSFKYNQSHEKDSKARKGGNRGAFFYSVSVPVSANSSQRTGRLTQPGGGLYTTVFSLSCNHQHHGSIQAQSCVSFPPVSLHHQLQLIPHTSFSPIAPSLALTALPLSSLPSTHNSPPSPSISNVSPPLAITLIPSAPSPSIGFPCSYVTRLQPHASAGSLIHSMVGK